MNPASIPGPAAATSPARPPGRAQAWWLAIRPRTLGASLAPVAVGTAVAFDAGAARWDVGLLCAGTALALQIATNLANDAFDALHGVDRGDRIGPPRATQAGWLSARAVLGASAAALAIATLLGLALVKLGGLPILAAGLISLAAAWGYSSGPFPLAAHGLGEVAAFVFFGLLAVCGTTYLHLGELPARAWLAALPVAALITNLMVVNNLRDIGTDAAAGKRTLAVRIGALATRRLFWALLGLAYALPPLLVLDGGRPERLLPWITLPWAIALGRAVGRAGSPEAFGDALMRSARLHVATCALLALGLAL